MRKPIYMLDTNTCSFLIRKKPEYLLVKLQDIVLSGHQVVISSITYAELTFSAINKKASPKMPGIVDEFVNRLDEIVFFEPLMSKDIEKIADLQIDRLRKRLKEKQINFEITDVAKKLLGNLGFDINYGARPLKRVIQRTIIDTISMEILKGLMEASLTS